MNVKILQVGGKGGAPGSPEWAGEGRPSLDEADCGLSDLSDGTAGEYFRCKGG